jgi:ribosomal protein L24E
MFKEPRGLTVFTFDGKSVYFCSSKCRKNTFLKRDSRKVNWIRKDKGSKAVFEQESPEKSEKDGFKSI